MAVAVGSIEIYRYLRILDIDRNTIDIHRYSGYLILDTGYWVVCPVECETSVIN